MWIPAHSVHAVSHKVDALSCDGACSAHEGGCSETAVFAVHQQFHFTWMQCCCSGCKPTALSENVDAVPMVWMQCPTMSMQFVVMQDAVSLKVDAVILQWLQCPLPFP